MTRRGIKVKLGSIRDRAVQWLERRLVNKLLPTGNIERLSVDSSGSADHQEYLQYQMEKSLSLSAYTNRLKWARSARKGLIDDLRNLCIERSIEPREIVAIGCRDEIEIRLLSGRFKLAKVTGLDLFSANKDIIIGDMHALPFGSMSFDAVLMNHSLEHSNRVEQALSEAIRCLKKGGLLAIEVPIRYEISKSDLVDFGSIAGLLETMKNFDEMRLLYGKDIYRGDDGSSANMRAIFVKL